MKKIFLKFSVVVIICNLVFTGSLLAKNKTGSEKDAVVENTKQDKQNGGIYLSGGSITGNIVDKNKDAARKFIIESPTFAFDGIEDTLELLSYRPVKSFNVWEFIYIFTCNHGGYGDRKGKILTQALEDHTVHLNIVDYVVVEAVIDSEWDMLKQEYIKKTIE
ncbi:MAG: hypothetical protein ABH857_05055 [Elusimicrobiota bacterium]